jgi:hypothetical protein
MRIITMELADHPNNYVAKVRVLNSGTTVCDL